MFEASAMTAAEVSAGSADSADAAQRPALVQVRGLKMYFPIYAGLKPDNDCRTQRIKAER